MRKAFRAIVIDDMDFCRELLTDFLQDRGYQVVSYTDVTTCPLFPARDALCPKTGKCADFLLTDNRMPHMQGLDFIELLQQGDCKISPFGRAIFSAHWSQDERTKAEQLGCRTFDKPYDLERLAHWLDEQERKIPCDRSLLDIADIMSGRPGK
ncbi:Response regulator receiver domain-containing protein [Malonomonas rubra DSM 5091]|uniref:Response regulator receiver domain-containing protein n=1 Tax=Malonomonas rubra DSM 5091 TaxID=1122189 RepID=A0A1M6EWB2_MALRU|nr:response regulator [Malonomonas rubra]SHI89703.1 Response regulator receiver domain-containing protein [Malonomonas rubra DSM 5091]